MTIKGFEGKITVTISGDGNPQLQKNNEGWTNYLNDFSSNDNLTLRLTTSSNYNTSQIVNLTLGNFNTSWMVQTTDKECYYEPSNFYWSQSAITIFSPGPGAPGVVQNEIIYFNGEEIYLHYGPGFLSGTYESENYQYSKGEIITETYHSTLPDFSKSWEICRKKINP